MNRPKYSRRLRRSIREFSRFEGGNYWIEAGPKNYVTLYGATMALCPKMRPAQVRRRRRQWAAMLTWPIARPVADTAAKR